MADLLKHEGYMRAPGKKEREVDNFVLDEIGEYSTSDDEDSMPLPAVFSRASTMPRSRSTTSMRLLVTVEDQCLRQVSGSLSSTGMQSPMQASSRGMSRSFSVPNFETKQRSDYNRAMGEEIANSPKKAKVDQSHDMELMEQLLASLKHE
jgi:hypothetical protein